MIHIVFWAWYAIGTLLLWTIGVPDVLQFSNGLFLVFYGLYALSLVFTLSDQSVKWWRRGHTWLAAAVIWTGGMSVEWLGVHTGWPFGQYEYSRILGWHLFGVPVTLGFAWIGVVCSGALLASRLPGGRSNLWIRALLTAALAVLLDLVLDPVAHLRGFWSWEAAGGFYGVPLSNFAAWFIVGGLLTLILPALQPEARRDLRAVRLYQLILLMFGVLGLQADLWWCGLVMVLGMLLAEGSRKI